MDRYDHFVRFSRLLYLYVRACLGGVVEVDHHFLVLYHVRHGKEMIVSAKRR